MLKSDTDVYTTFEGDNTVLMQLVAKGLLTEYRQQFGSMRLGGVIRFLASQASRRIVASNPVAARNTDEAHLRDPEAQEFLLRYREERMLGSVARRLKRCSMTARIRSTPSRSARITCCKLAHAHIERRGGVGIPHRDCGRARGIVRPDPHRPRRPARATAASIATRRGSSPPG